MASTSPGMTISSYTISGVATVSLRHCGVCERCKFPNLNIYLIVNLSVASTDANLQMNEKHRQLVLAFLLAVLFLIGTCAALLALFFIALSTQNPTYSSLCMCTLDLNYFCKLDLHSIVGAAFWSLLVFSLAYFSYYSKVQPWRAPDQYPQFNWACLFACGLFSIVALLEFILPPIAIVIFLVQDVKDYLSFSNGVSDLESAKLSFSAKSEKF
jgi:hypothetical protein